MSTESDKTASHSPSSVPLAKSIDLEIKTLSPVYIGTGEEYNGLSYIADGGSVKFYDLHGIIDDMPQKDDFINFISKAVDEDPKSRPSLKELLNEVFGKETYAELVSRCVYELPLAGEISDRGTIRTFMAEGKNGYIPGTEIKGAIRTGILYYFLNPKLHDRRSNLSSKLYSSLKKKIDKEKRLTIGRLRDIEKDLEQRAFRKVRDARYDLLKYLLVRDSQPKSVEECLFVSSIKVLNVHKREKRPGGKIIIPCQLCRKNQVFVCRDAHINDNPVIAGQLGFSDEQRWALQFTDELPNFFQCCYEFSRKLLQKEIDYFNRKDSVLDMHLLTDNLEVESEDEAREILDQVVGKLEEIQEQNKPGTPVIRLGGSQGYFSTTTSLILKELDPGIYEKVARAIAKRGVLPSQFPRTRRLVLNLDEEYDTLGWVQLSTNSD